MAQLAPVRHRGRRHLPDLHRRALRLATPAIPGPLHYRAADGTWSVLTQEASEPAGWPNLPLGLDDETHYEHFARAARPRRPRPLLHRRADRGHRRDGALLGESGLLEAARQLDPPGPTPLDRRGPARRRSRASRRRTGRRRRDPRRPAPQRLDLAPALDRREARRLRQGLRPEGRVTGPDGGGYARHKTTRPGEERGQRPTSRASRGSDPRGPPFHVPHPPRPPG